CRRWLTCSSSFRSASACCCGSAFLPGEDRTLGGRLDDRHLPIGPSTNGSSSSRAGGYGGAGSGAGRARPDLGCISRVRRLRPSGNRSRIPALGSNPAFPPPSAAPLGLRPSQLETIIAGTPGTTLVCRDPEWPRGPGVVPTHDHGQRSGSRSREGAEDGSADAGRAGVSCAREPDSDHLAGGGDGGGRGAGEGIGPGGIGRGGTGAGFWGCISGLPSLGPKHISTLPADRRRALRQGRPGGSICSILCNLG